MKNFIRVPLKKYAFLFCPHHTQASHHSPHTLLLITSAIHSPVKVIRPLSMSSS